MADDALRHFRCHLKQSLKFYKDCCFSHEAHVRDFYKLEEVLELVLDLERNAVNFCCKAFKLKSKILILIISDNKGEVQGFKISAMLSFLMFLKFL